jgi:hypothetical protein
MSKEKIRPDYDDVANPMTAANKRKWLKALRSGKYRKGRRELHTQRGHCCLGVADREFGFAVQSTKFLHKGVAQQAMFLPLDEQEELAQLNDKSAGFDKVIEMIERIEPYKGVKR